MTVVNTIETDLVVAMKEHDAERTSLLRMLKSALKNAEIDSGKELPEQEVFAILEKQAKQRRDAAEQYKLGGRLDLAEKELSEAEAVAKYLPTKLSEEEVAALVEQKIAELHASSMADMGKVIGAVVSEAAGTADSAVVAKIAKQKLA